jgi:ribosomal protein L11 methyltransferase
LGLDAENARLRVIEIEDEGWVERYQAALQPFALGKRFVVDPTGSGIVASNRRSIRLVPGRAFGTGEHATTQICAEQLERRVVAGSRWLDVGCGTAILSVVACACGAQQVLGLDDDPEALRVAGNVLKDNPEAHGIALVCGSVDAAARAVWDGVVVNISTAFLLREAAGLAARLKAGGWLIASGFLGDDLSTVVGALNRFGLAQVELDERDGWAGLVARRSGAPSQTRAGLSSSESGPTDPL